MKENITSENADEFTSENKGNILIVDDEIFVRSWKFQRDIFKDLTDAEMKKFAGLFK